MLRLLISLLIQLFFQRPAGIAPGQKAQDIDAALERLERSVLRRPTANAIAAHRPGPPQPSFDLAPDLDFSL